VLDHEAPDACPQDIAVEIEQQTDGLLEQSHVREQLRLMHTYEVCRDQ